MASTDADTSTSSTDASADLSGDSSSFPYDARPLSGSSDISDYSSQEPEDPRAIIFFDIDNTLYSASSRIADAMGTRIHLYFTSLGLSETEASEMHLRYYKMYGLALRGLVRHHQVDPLDFDQRYVSSHSIEKGERRKLNRRLN